MEWSLLTGPPLELDPYPSAYPPPNPPWALRPGAATTYPSTELGEAISPYPPPNPPWAPRPGAATTYPSTELGEAIFPYPPPLNKINFGSHSEQYPPGLNAHQHNFPPKPEPHNLPSSNLFNGHHSESYTSELSTHQQSFPLQPKPRNDSWLIQSQEFDHNVNTSASFSLNPDIGPAAPSVGGEIPRQPYPYLHSTESYPPSSFSNSFSSPHGTLPSASTTPSAPPPLHSTELYPPSSFSGSFSSHETLPGDSTTPSAPPPPPNCTADPPAYHLGPTPAQPWCAATAAPNVPSAGQGLSFGCAPPSAHPLLQSFEDDVVPYYGGYPSSGGGEADDPKPGDRDDEKFDYSHKTLEKYGENLTTRAIEGSLDPVIGRDLVVRQCIEILTRKSKCNPVLVGHPGVGKTAVVEGLAQRIVKGDVPEPLRKCKIICVDFQNVTATTKWRGDFEQNMKELIEGATEAKRKVILFFDELHRIIGAGKCEGQVDTGSEILKPALARGDFLCIGATTHDEYNKYVEKDQALARRFQKVIVDPPSPENTVYILRGLKPRLESHHGISIADDALVEAVKLSERYVPDRYLPDKAIDLVDVAASKLKIGLISKPEILDEIDHAILELDMERLSVTSATTAGQALQQGRLQQILSDLEGLKSRQTNLTRKWKKEKALTSRILSLREKITAAKTGSKPASSDPSGLGSDAEKSGSGYEVHVLIVCDSCQESPIIGPRYSHESENMDLCEECWKMVNENDGYGHGYFSLDKFHPVKPPQVICNTCMVYPIIGNYYVNNQNRNNVLCQPCWQRWRSQPSESMNFYFECQNDLKGTQTEIQHKETEKTNGFVSANVKEFEAQLEAAEKEWKEYQNSYKPLMQLEVTSTAIAEVLSLRTGIPVAKMQTSQAQQLLHLDVELHKRVIGQDEACNAIARAIQRSRAGLADPKRPIASLMFMGPTGVGKTELSKALAIHLFNSEDAMVRIDMSEYGDKHNISRLTGSAPGLVGYGDGGQLTTPVRRQPYSVVLFDEIEKADDDIFNIFLQILDDGRLTDSEGRVVNFTNTVIIMTSNVGAEKIMEVTANSKAYSCRDEVYQMMKSHVLEAARAKYRPEFINRIDEFIVFQPLNPQQICEIVKLQLERVSKRLQDRHINLRISESALQLLSSMGYDPRYGARPVKRVIQQSIEDALAQGILRGQYMEGCTIMIDTEFSCLGSSQQPQQRLTFLKLP